MRKVLILGTLFLPINLAATHQTYEEFMGKFSGISLSTEAKEELGKFKILFENAHRLPRLAPEEENLHTECLKKSLQECSQDFQIEMIRSYFEVPGHHSIYRKSN